LEIKELINSSNLQIDKNKIFYEEPMSKHTSFKIGGPAECLIKINDIKDLKEVLIFSKENKIPVTIFGNGSNILVLDKGIKGIVLKIQMESYTVIQEKDKVKVIVSSGMKVGKLAKMLQRKGITGFEELSGIPGTIGGAIIMNAGAHGKEIKDVVKKVKTIDYEGNEKTYDNQQMGFEYRKSILKNKKCVVTEVELELQRDKEESIKQKMDEYVQYRKERQPIEFPSAGSTFKRGEDFITAKLIDDAGLKGYCIGGAEVSTKHSGFIINKGNASAKDILDLVEYIKEKIYDKFNKKIELEIEVIGEE